jgi:hypothetical protein
VGVMACAILSGAFESRAEDKQISNVPKRSSWEIIFIIISFCLV